MYLMEFTLSDEEWWVSPLVSIRNAKFGIRLVTLSSNRPPPFHPPSFLLLLLLLLFLSPPSLFHPPPSHYAFTDFCSSVSTFISSPISHLPNFNLPQWTQYACVFQLWICLAVIRPTHFSEIFPPFI